jgi:hypothetical protein
MAFDLTTILGKNLGEFVADIIGKFKVDPTVKAQLEQELALVQPHLREIEIEANTKLNDIAGQNIRAETQSEDAYVRRGRPTVLYVGLIVIFWNYCITPIVGLHWGLKPVEIPSDFWWTWGVISTGYVFNRTAQEIMGMKGDSYINVGPIKLGQKSTP